MERTKKMKINRNVDMTKGSIIKNILLFAIPLFVGNLFQQFYNIVDSWAVGQFVSDDALGAVSSSGSLINFFTSLVVGTSAGAGIVIAQYFGAKDTERMKNSIHTTVAFGLILGLILTVLGVTCAPIALKLMKTPDNILSESVVYFRVYFCGVIFTCMYNTGSAIFRAVGDSRHPLYYLAVSTLCNIGLDLLFVAVFKLGVIGVALATIISQAISCTITFVHLMLTKEDYRVELKKIKIHKEEIGKIIAIGLPNGIQNSIISLSNVFVQTGINVFGDVATTGWGAYTKVEGFATMPSGSFSIAISNFVAQNVGAKEYERAKKGAWQGLLISMSICEVLGCLLAIFAPQLIGLFTDNEDIIAFGAQSARTIAVFYCLLACAHGLSGILRGAGVSTLPMYTMIICWCAVRIITITTCIETNQLTTPYIIYYLYPITWTISIIVLLPIMLRGKWLYHMEKKNAR